MKVFFVQTASKIDRIVKKDKKILENLSFEEIIKKYFDFGFISLFGISKNVLFKTEGDFKFYTNVTNSEYIQKKWAEERQVKYNEDNWKLEILYAQIESFKPDVIYTADYNFFNKHIKDYLPSAKLYVLWNASPIKIDIDLSHFDLGLSFNSAYHDQLKARGVKNTEFNSFYIDPEIKSKMEKRNHVKDIDIVFAGRYTKMFKRRNDFLLNIYRECKDKYRIKYFLLTTKRFYGLLPAIPWKLTKALEKPVFLEDMFNVFSRSKIVFNTHSNITGEYKGNMRVYEALGSGAFMLSDYGIYPDYLEDGKDFVTYKNKEDVIEKIDYYMKHEKERDEIAKRGYNKIAQYYSTEVGTKKLAQIFGKYL